MNSQTTPEWFTTMTNTEYERCTIEVDGCDIQYQRWANSDDKPVLVLIHGLFANGHWWDFIAPAFTEKFTVLAPHLSGMGESGTRDAYSFAVFAADVAHVIRDNAGERNVYVVGHSLGGRVALQIASQFAEDIDGFVSLDPILTTDLMYREARELESYPSKDEAIDAFKLIPAQECANDYILRYLAEQMIENRDDGWTFRGDHHLLLKLGADGQSPFDPSLAMGTIYGGSSAAFPEEMADWMRTSMPDLPLIKVADAAHHVMIDQPQQFAVELASLLPNWYPGYLAGDGKE